MMLDREAVNVISRSDGFVLLAFFLIFMRYTFAIARNGADEAGEEQKIKENACMEIGVVYCRRAGRTQRPRRTAFC